MSGLPEKSGKIDNNKSTDPPAPQFPALPLQAPPHQALTPEWLIDLDAAQDLERQTTLQRESLQWRVMHQSTITSSNFKLVLRCKTGVDGLLRSMFDGASLGNVKAVSHGQQYEKEAIATYKKTKSEKANRFMFVHEAWFSILGTDFLVLLQMA